MSSLALSVALATIENVRRFVDATEKKGEAIRQILELGEALSGPAATWAQDAAGLTEGRKYDYACVVILLYGALERYIEDVAEEYINNLVRDSERYDLLPEKMRNSHFTLTLAHLQRTRDSRYDGRKTAQEIVAAFAGCLSGAIPYEFVSESMISHTANFRPAVIDDYFGRLGVDAISRRAVRSGAFEGYLAGIGAAAPLERPEAALDLVNILVERRNEVAHGDISNTLAPSELMPFFDQVVAYCRSLSDVLDEDFVRYCAERYGVDHGPPIAVYNNKIVCIHSKGAVISVGSELALRRPEGTWCRAKVLNVEIDRAKVEATPRGEDVAVGLEIDGRCKPAYSVKSGVFKYE